MANGAVIEKRKSELIEFVIQGKRVGQILSFIKELDDKELWIEDGNLISESSLRLYLKDIKGTIAQENKLDAKLLFNLANKRYEMLYGMAVTKEDLSAALKATKEQIELNGIGLEKKVETIADDGYKAIRKTILESDEKTKKI
jgi:hypothetical protein